MPEQLTMACKTPPFGLAIKKFTLYEKSRRVRVRVRFR